MLIKVLKYHCDEYGVRSQTEKRMKYHQMPMHVMWDYADTSLFHKMLNNGEVVQGPEC